MDFLLCDSKELCSPRMTTDSGDLKLHGLF